MIGNRWARLRQTPDGIRASVARANDFRWLEVYLQTEIDLREIVETFPKDPHLDRAVNECRGLRLLRQEPWECLASFILSSTKQIVQIKEIVRLLCERFGEKIPAPPECGPVFGFPAAERIAAANEADLRSCKMGFRAPYLLETARMIASGEINLESLRKMDLPAARGELMRCVGVGRKIADCVLLFAYGFPQAFPIDVWILKAMRTLYFPRRRPSPKRLLRFTETYFGPNAGYAQQYLFHHIRTRMPTE